MRNLIYVVAAIVGGLVVLPQAGSTGALTSLGAAAPQIPVMSGGLVQKVHGWHCSKKKGWYKGDKVWHRHRRACYESQVYDDDDDDYYDYRYSRRSPNLYIEPGIRLHFGNQGDHD